MSVVDVEARPCDNYLDLQAAVKDYYDTIKLIDTAFDTDTGLYDQQRVGQVIQEMYDKQSKMFELIGVTHHGGKYESNT